MEEMIKQGQVMIDSIIYPIITARTALVENAVRQSAHRRTLNQIQRAITLCDRMEKPVALYQQFPGQSTGDAWIVFTRRLGPHIRTEMLILSPRNKTSMRDLEDLETIFDCDFRLHRADRSSI